MSTRARAFELYGHQLAALLVKNGQLDHAAAEAAVTMHADVVQRLFDGYDGEGMWADEAWKILLSVIEEQQARPEQIWLTREEGFLPGWYDLP